MSTNIPSADEGRIDRSELIFGTDWNERLQPFPRSIRAVLRAFPRVPLHEAVFHLLDERIQAVSSRPSLVGGTPGWTSPEDWHPGTLVEHTIRPDAWAILGDGELCAGLGIPSEFGRQHGAISEFLFALYFPMFDVLSIELQDAAVRQIAPVEVYGPLRCALQVAFGYHPLALEPVDPLGFDEMDRRVNARNTNAAEERRLVRERLLGAILDRSPTLNAEVRKILGKARWSREQRPAVDHDLIRSEVQMSIIERDRSPLEPLLDYKVERSEVRLTDSILKPDNVRESLAKSKWISPRNRKQRNLPIDPDTLAALTSIDSPPADPARNALEHVEALRQRMNDRAALAELEYQLGDKRTRREIAAQFGVSVRQMETRAEGVDAVIETYRGEHDGDP